MKYKFFAFMAVAAFCASPLFAQKTVELTPEQKAAIVLEPELSDAFYGQVDRLYLNGMWKFKPELNLLEAQPGENMRFKQGADMRNPAVDAGLTSGYFRPGYDAKSWSELPVPWPWNITTDFKKGKNVKIPFAGLGYYRHSFSIPSGKKGMRAILHFASVQTECRVWLNGVELGTHVNSSPHGGPPWDFNQRLWLDDFEFDITKIAVFGGENTLVVRVFDDGQPLEERRWPDDGGITGPVTIDFTGEIRTTELLVSGNPATGAVRINAALYNDGTAAAELPLQAEIAPFTSAFYTPPEKVKSNIVDLGVTRIPPGTSRHSFSFTIEKPAAWSLESPFLYRLRLLSKGTVVGQTRFGFRTFEVSGGRFLLNGHPVYLRGSNPTNSWNQNQRILAFNKANWLREGLKLFKAANFNLLRVNNGPETKIFYDICDELGILTEDDFAVDSTDLQPDEARADMIKSISVASYVGADGKPIPAKAAVIRQWLGRLHNHPAVCMFTAGNEIGFSKRSGSSESDLAAYMNFFYDFIKSSDLQKRPVTPSSGLTVWMWSTPLKADYYDYHNYANGYNGWAGSGGENWTWRNHLARIYGKLDKPVINGECGGYEGGRACRKDIAGLAENGELDKTKYVKWANGISLNTGSISYHDYIARSYYAVFNGIRSGISKEAASMSTARLNYLYSVAMRRDMDFLEGFVLHDLDPAHFGLDPVNPFLTRSLVAGMAEKCRTNQEFLALRDALAPQAAFLDMCDRHGVAGGALISKIFLFNDLSAEPDLKVELSLEDSSGAVCKSIVVPFSNVRECSRLSAPFTLPIPAGLATGDYLLRTRLLKGNTVIHESASPFFVLASTGLKPLSTTRKVAVFDRVDVPAGGTASRLLTDFGVTHEKIGSLKNLDHFDVLILGPGVIDGKFAEHAPELRSWLERGGRIVCLEQSFAGPIPFAAELRYQSSGSMLFADVINIKHPLFDDLKPWHFEIWNGEREQKAGYLDAGGKAVYSSLIVPMPEGVALSGGTGGAGWVRNPVFGMVAGEVKVGKGLVLFSQALAVSRHGTDSVADLYLRNLLSYTLSDAWNGERASVLTGPKALMLDRKKCFFVDISKAANRAFTDEKDGDRLGGWTDQGANDLRMIPKGEVFFNGVPYRIIDDKGGKIPSCIVLRGKDRPYFAKEVTGIPVDRKARRLCFLQATAWGAAEKAGEYLVHYANGGTAVIELFNDKNIGGWWSPVGLPEAPVACEFIQSSGNRVGLYTFAWENPHPDWKIISIDLVSSGGPVVVCAAITGE